MSTSSIDLNDTVTFVSRGDLLTVPKALTKTPSQQRWLMQRPFTVSPQCDRIDSAAWTLFRHVQKELSDPLQVDLWTYLTYRVGRWYVRARWWKLWRLPKSNTLTRWGTQFERRIIVWNHRSLF